MNLGIIGNGFVGSAVAFGFSSQCGFDEATTRIYDKDNKKSTHSLSDVLTKSDYIFVSVPTPSNQDGSISLKIVYNLFDEINKTINEEHAWGDGFKEADSPVLILRSTMIPGATRELQNKYPKLNIVFNPEFLTERSAKFDFINPARFILGGDAKYTNQVKENVFVPRFGKHIPIIETNYETAELIKYVGNTFFATKVSFMNEMRKISDEVGANWDTVIEGFVTDGRVGHSHLNVPGPDGKYGFGGSCFPKDVQALLKFGKDLDINLNTLKGVWDTNLEVRPERDWEELKGRAVTDE